MKGKQKMEEKIIYFEKPGKENTTEVIKLVLERAKLRNINRIVVASIKGYTANLRCCGRKKYQFSCSSWAIYGEGESIPTRISE